MRTIEQLLLEVIIRFGINWEDTPIRNELNTGGYPPLISHDLIFNRNGKIFGLDDEGNGVWATADIKEVPDKWVVEKDKNHPRWTEIVKYLKRENPFGLAYQGRLKYYSEERGDDDLLSFEGHQYLTLDQWVELFLPKKQEVDFSILNDEDWFYVELDVLDRKAIHVLRGVELKTHKYETDGYEVECLFYKMGYGYHEPYKATLNMNSSIHNIRDCIRVLRKATPEDLKPLYNKYPELVPLKVGDWAIGYDDPHHQRNLKKVQKELEKYGILNIGIFHHMNCDEYYIGDELWDNAYKIHPNQPLDKQIDNFLKLQLK